MELAGDTGEFKNFMERSAEIRNFLIGIIVSGLLAWAFSYTPWVLVIIAGIVAGLLNKDMRRGSLSGSIGVGLSWLGMMLYGGFSNNVFLLLDQFGGLLDLENIGWLLFLIVLIIGFILGALGGAIGGSVIKIINDARNNDSPDNK